MSDEYGLPVNMPSAPEPTAAATSNVIPDPNSDSAKLQSQPYTPNVQTPAYQQPVSTHDAANTTATNAKAGTPNQPQPQQQPPQPHSIFRSIMDTLAGPSFSYKVDPNTGQMVKTPITRTKSQLANSIVAGALTGMLAGAGERGPGNVGRAFAAGGAANMSRLEQGDRSKQATASSDFTRQAAIMENNLRLRQNALSVTKLDYDMQKSYADDGQKIIDSLSDQPGALLEGGQKFKASDIQDLMKKYNITSDMAIPVGVTPVIDPATGKQAVDENGMGKNELQYQLINPNFSVTVPQDLINKFVKWGIPGFVDSKGNPIALPKDAKTSAIIVARATHQVQMLEIAQHKLDEWNKTNKKTTTAPSKPVMVDDPKNGGIANTGGNPKSAALPTQISSIAESTAQKYGVDSNLVKAIIAQESNGNPKAVSKAGAKGLMQLMDGTAKQLGVKDPFDINENIDAGVRYFKDLLDQFGGDTKLALAAYNAGPDAVIKAGYEVPNFKETKDYVAKITKNAGIKDN